jgi:glycyl-tRNA synthetase
LTLADGDVVSIEEQHVKMEQRREVVNGEWFIPHVVEPAFGIDRIIWHILDHAWQETEKNGEKYSLLALKSCIAPIDVVVLPLMEKDGMDKLAKQLHRDLCSSTGVLSISDASGSIGRRYARADEIGVPWAVTIDHQSVEDGSATIRERDTQKQVRFQIGEIPQALMTATLSASFH